MWPSPKLYACKHQIDALLLNADLEFLCKDYFLELFFWGEAVLNIVDKI